MQPNLFSLPDDCSLVPTSLIKKPYFTWWTESMVFPLPLPDKFPLINNH